MSGFTPNEMMTIAASRALRNDDVCFVGIGAPSAACNVARLTHAPDITLPTFSSQPFAMNFAGTVLALVESMDVVVYRWSGAAWSREMLIARPALTSNDAVAWGQALAFDRGGTLLAIGYQTFMGWVNTNPEVPKVSIETETTAVG